MKKNYLFLFPGLLTVLFIACGDHEKPATTTDTPATEQSYGHPAIDKLSRQIAETPNSATLYAARAEAWYANENYDEGIADLEKAIALDSTKAEYYHVLADMYLDYFKSRLALNTMKRAAEVFPTRIPTLLKLSEFQLILERHNDALFTLEKIRAIDPLNAEMLFMFGRVFKDMGKPDEALGAFQTAVENDPNLIDAWVNLAQLLADKNSPLVDKYFDNALRIDSNNIEALHAKAYYLSNKKNDLDGAIQVYKKINTIDQQYVEGYYNTGLIYLDMDSMEQAYNSFNIAVKYAPQYAEAYFHRGFAAEKKGDLQQALADYKTVLNFDPNFASAKAGVERLEK